MIYECAVIAEQPMALLTENKTRSGPLGFKTRRSTCQYLYYDDRAIVSRISVCSFGCLVLFKARVVLNSIL